VHHPGHCGRNLLFAVSLAAVQPLSDRALLGAIRQLAKWREWPQDWTQERLAELKTELLRREREDAETESPKQYE
jgi:hypothetical protein